jgi:Kinesin motor domain
MKHRTLKHQTLPGDEDSLERLLHSESADSSVSSSGAKGFASDGESSRCSYDNDDNSSQARQNNIPSIRRGRAKSRYSSDRSLRKFGQSNQLQPPRSKRSSISTKISRTGRLSMIKNKDDDPQLSDGASLQSHHQDLAVTKSMSGISSVSEIPLSSWADQIEDLREQNDEEYEMFFRDHVDSANSGRYYLDMRIKVIVRKRPLSKTERRNGGVDIIHPLDCGDYGKILLYQPKTRLDLTEEIETVPFAFDDVFDESSTNVQIYERSVRHLIEPFFAGQFVTCFAYGATGSGKTFTMMGSQVTGINAGTATDDESNLGLYYLAALDIFSMLQSPEYRNLGVQVSLFEIYGGKLFDLLSAKKKKEIKCLEDSSGAMCFRGLDEFRVESPEQVMELIGRGSNNRSTGETSANADSSRSHAILQIKLVDSSNRRKIVERGECLLNALGRK